MKFEKNALRGMISTSSSLMIQGQDNFKIGLLVIKIVTIFTSVQRDRGVISTGTIPDEKGRLNICVMCSLVRGADNLKKNGLKLSSPTDFISWQCFQKKPLAENHSLWKGSQYVYPPVSGQRQQNVY